jgi:hypothetical protein
MMVNAVMGVLLPVTGQIILPIPKIPLPMVTIRPLIKLMTINASLIVTVVMDNSVPLMIASAKIFLGKVDIAMVARLANARMDSNATIINAVRYLRIATVITTVITEGTNGLAWRSSIIS